MNGKSPAAQVDDPRFESRLHCIPKLPFEDLRELTASADVGLSLDQGGHGNYEMSLPNKLFDFMHGRLPMVVTARKAWMNLRLNGLWTLV